MIRVDPSEAVRSEDTCPSWESALYHRAAGLWRHILPMLLVKTFEVFEIFRRPD